MSKLKIAVIVGSVRPTRAGDRPAKWIAELAKQTGDFDVELVDLIDYPLPLFDAPASDLWMPTPNEIAAKWQAKLSEFDGYIFVAAEYNHSISGALKNAIDWAYKPFIKKAVAYVSYGAVGGVRAVEHLRNVMVELQAVSGSSRRPYRRRRFHGGDVRQEDLGRHPADLRALHQGPVRQSALVGRRDQGRARGREGGGKVAAA